ncbi:DUF7674 family protein [Dyadobacter frigoris]|uniref:DUF7674 domain-containing protein n=1 Tax=Dyadobacter frigoris TaxID=2576211 RepID=A0A4U6D3Z0_9BACT|nr:hypothetical protein [Dyadobacter frigoris]TKT88654.1 hypothetical protein FDK13_25435 [Dyadobacter frigoris]GLU53834.1 hypothetical protein Dfri01_32950 [Dyadobacter frigoris]
MITQFQVIGLLKEELPKITHDGNFQEIPRAFSSIHAAIYSLSDFTRINLELKHFQTARKCFALAEKIYLEGDIMVQLLIEKVFIDSLVLAKKAKTKNHLAILIPPALQKVYLKHLGPQIPPSHI